MKYLGSKNRIAKELLPVILKDIQPSQYYVEPFVGGCNMIDKVKHPLKLGGDNNQYLIAMWKELQKGWIPPTEVSREEYNDIKSNKNQCPDYLIGYTGFNCSYMGKWFAGYSGSNKTGRNYILESYRNITKQIPDILDINFYLGSYDTLPIPYNSIIYCDPPYAGTTGYKDKFDSMLFWQWCRDKVKEGNKVFISEYSAPNDFKCIWQKEITNSLNHNKAIEKLFVYDGLL